MWKEGRPAGALLALALDGEQADYVALVAWLSAQRPESQGAAWTLSARREGTDQLLRTRCLPPHHGADALVGQQLQQHRVWQPAIDDVGRADTALHRIEGAANLR